MIMKDFDLTRQNWQRAKVQAECVLPEIACGVMKIALLL